jgi:hypothetical protein
MATKTRFAVTLLLIYGLGAVLMGMAITLGRGFLPDNQHILQRFCALPCLLNITPGETERSSALPVLSALADFPVDQTGTIWSFQFPDDDGNLISGTLISGENGISARWTSLTVARLRATALTCPD